MTALAGIDVSNYQGVFDWAAYKGKIGFAYAKATEGETFTDKDFTRNWAQMRDEGLIRGAYHFAHPNDDVTTEAAHFLAVVKAAGLLPGDFLVLDLETTNGESVSWVASWAKAFDAHVHAATGAHALAYTDGSMARGGYFAGLGDSPLCLANPGGGPVAMPIGPWREISMEQTGQRGVDTDVFYGTAAQLRALGVPEPKPKPAPAPVGPVPWQKTAHALALNAANELAKLYQLIGEHQ
jgi:lysozyme